MSVLKKKSFMLLLVLVIALGIVTGVYVTNQTNKTLDYSQLHGTFLKKPRDLKSFTLIGTHNQPFTNHSVKNQWTMLFFGFTRCAYVCPNTMSELAKMYRLLEDKSLNVMPQVVMISIDPDRDSLEKLNYYVKAFNPHFMGAIGGQHDIRALTQELGIAYAKVDLPAGQDKNQYDIQHSGAIMLLNPEGKLQAFFTPPIKADELAEDFHRLAKLRK